MTIFHIISRIIINISKSLKVKFLPQTLLKLIYFQFSSKLFPRKFKGQIWVKQSIEKHGSFIEVIEVISKGSIFSFYFNDFHHLLAIKFDVCLLSDFVVPSRHTLILFVSEKLFTSSSCHKFDSNLTWSKSTYFACLTHTLHWHTLKINRTVHEFASWCFQGAF